MHDPNALSNTVYTMNTPRMTYETVEQETVAIDTETGVYFRISGSGHLIIQMLEPGASIAMLVKELAVAYNVDAASVHPQVAAFVAALEAEDIVIPAPGTGAAASLPPVCGQKFVPPELEKFTDMHDLLLMDPIHEVSDAGWPHSA